MGITPATWNLPRGGLGGKGCLGGHTTAIWRDARARTPRMCSRQRLTDYRCRRILLDRQSRSRSSMYEGWLGFLTPRQLKPPYLL